MCNHEIAKHCFHLLIIALVILVPLFSCADRGFNIGCFRKGNADHDMHISIRADSVDSCLSNCEKLFYK